MLQILGLLSFEWLFCLSNLLIKPRMLAYDKGLRMQVKCNKFNSSVYGEWKKERFQLESEFGYTLSCELLEACKQDNKKAADRKIAVLCHALGCAKFESIKYAELFIKLGYTVVIYDHRNHGLSGKSFTSMGYFEKYDLKKVIDWCVLRFGKQCRFVTHGESMGAATVLLHLDIDSRISAVIADCAYSDLTLLLRHQLKQYYHIPALLLPLESCIVYIRAGFWFHKVSPIKAVLRTDTPILFIHGKRDGFVPASMSRQMYDCKKRNKAIFLVAKARHAESYCKNRAGYEKRVENFLKHYLEKDTENA